MLGIKNNLMADNAARYLSTSYNALSKSVERLSSGLRINSAKDDAAGLAVRELVRADVAQLKQASRNAQDGVSMLQTAEGALGVVDDMLVRMKELAEQASTGSYSGAQREIMDAEYNQLAEEITHIATSTTFNGTSLLDGTAASVSFHIGSTSISFATDNMQASQIAANSALTSTGATAQVIQSTAYVASASDIYIQGDAAESADKSKISTGVGADTITITFGAKTLDVGLSAYAGAGKGISLNDLVMEINKEATLEGIASPIASAVYDTTYKAYRLELTGPTAGLGADKEFGFGAVANTNLTGFDNVNDFTELTNNLDAGSKTLLNTTDAATLIGTVTTAIETKDKYRAKLGYYMNRLESATQILDIQAENLSAAESRISDVDTATEMAAMTRNKVLAQAGVSMLAQANGMPEMALTLLRG